jgi:hypothetical protein
MAKTVKFNMSLDNVPGEKITPKSKPITKKKPIEKDISIKDKKKPIIKKADKKEGEKLKKVVIKEIKEENENRPEAPVEIIKTPDIEYIITETTKYDVNWFALKQMFVKFERWLISPWTKYKRWWNRVVNHIIEEDWKTTDNLNDLYDDIPALNTKTENLNNVPVLKTKINKKQVENFSETELEDIIKIKRAMEIKEDKENGIVRSDK